MAPKKKTRAEGEATPAQQRREEAARAKAAEDEALEKERLATIAADELVLRHTDARPGLPVADIFDKVIKRKDFKSRAKGQGRVGYDWSDLREQLAKRTADSPVWFMHVREEDLILDPDGLDGETVETAVIVEATEPTLAPMHMVVREARPFSDLEDNTPERILKLADHGFCWREVRGEGGAAINVFLLQRRADSEPKATSTAGGVAGKSFSFGATSTAASAAPAVAAAKPAPVAGFGSASAAVSTTATAGSDAAPAPSPSASFGFAGNSSGAVPATAAAAPAKAASFGFGGGAAAPVAPATGFGFGNAGPAQGAANALAAAAKASGAEPTSFGAAATSAAPTPSAAAVGMFGGRPVTQNPQAAAPQAGGFAAPAAPVAAAPASAAPASAGFAAGFGAKSSSNAAGGSSGGLGDNVSLSNVQFTLWTEARLKEMKKEVLAGSRIIIEGFQLPPPVDRKSKVQMQNDLKDRVDSAVDFIVRKEFARLNDDMTKVDEWIDDCPVYDEKLAAAIQKFRERQLDECIDESSDADAKGFAAVDRALRPILTAEFEKRVAERKAMLDKEASDIDDIVQLVKKKRVLATKAAYKIFKYYPKNDVLLFRPFGKVGGVHEAGETADVCVPAAYVPKNLFAAKVAAMKAE